MKKNTTPSWLPLYGLSRVHKLTPSFHSHACREVLATGLEEHACCRKRRNNGPLHCTFPLPVGLPVHINVHTPAYLPCPSPGVQQRTVHIHTTSIVCVCVCVCVRAMPLSTDVIEFFSIPVMINWLDWEELLLNLGLLSLFVPVASFWNCSQCCIENPNRLPLNNVYAPSLAFWIQENEWIQKKKKTWKCIHSHLLFNIHCHCSANWCLGYSFVNPCPV